MALNMSTLLKNWDLFLINQVFYNTILLLNPLRKKMLYRVDEMYCMVINLDMYHCHLMRRVIYNC